MNNKKSNYYEYFNELSISTVTLMMSYYRVTADEIESQWLWGDVIIGIILFHCFISLCVIWFWMVRHSLLLLALLAAYLQPYIDYFLWRLRRCWNWNKPVEDLNDLVPPEERKKGNSQAFLIIQRIKKERHSDAERKVRKFKIDTVDDDKNVAFDEKDKEDVELNVGKVGLAPGAIKVDGDGKQQHTRSMNLNVEENSADDEEEIRSMQKRIADTGLLNTLKANEIVETKLGTEESNADAVLNESDFAQEENTMRAGTNANLLDALKTAKQEIDNQGETYQLPTDEPEDDDLEQIDTSVNRNKPKPRTRADNRRGGRKKSRGNRLLQQLQEQVSDNTSEM